MYFDLLLYCVYYASIVCTMYLLSVVCIYCLYYVSILGTMYYLLSLLDVGLLLTQIPDGWLEVSNRKVLRPAISTQIFFGFSGS
jgi:hypothetical protein